MHAITINSVVLATILTSAFAQNVTTGALGDATVVDNNPPGTTYVATLPEMEFFNPSSPNIKGSVSGTASPDGKGVMFSVSLSNFPASGGPFLYHIHSAPVPADGNCTGTLAHLDPFIRGEMPPCDSAQPQTCQVGDLSGKHGKVAGTELAASYTDLYASTLPGIGAFFGNRSITIHFANTTRITCANFTMSGSSTTGSNSSSSSGSSGSSSSSSPAMTAPPITGLGAKNIASIGMALGAAAFAMLL